MSDLTPNLATPDVATTSPAPVSRGSVPSKLRTVAVAALGVAVVLNALSGARGGALAPLVASLLAIVAGVLSVLAASYGIDRARTATSPAGSGRIRGWAFLAFPFAFFGTLYGLAVLAV